MFLIYFWLYQTNIFQDILGVFTVLGVALIVLGFIRLGEKPKRYKLHPSEKRWFNRRGPRRYL